MCQSLFVGLIPLEDSRADPDHPGVLTGIRLTVLDHAHGAFLPAEI
jgi:hypothetical protein